MKGSRYIVNAFLIFLVSAFIILCIRRIATNHSGSKGDNIPQFIDQDTTVNPKIAKGKKFFNSICASCHAIKTKVIGPALANIEERGPWKDRNKLYQWITNPEKFIQTDKYTQELRAKEVVMMQGYPGLTMEELDALLEYIKSASQPQSSRIAEL